jgi:hypothetical protein
MRFMAILALCLVAIFALVQSLPIEAQPRTPATAAVVEARPEIPEEIVPEPQAPPPTTTPDPVAKPAVEPPEPARAIVLTRPKWVSTFQPRQQFAEAPIVEPQPEIAESPAAKPAVETTPAPVPEAPPAAPPVAEQEGFTLRFESDIALTRLVATGQVGFYAIDADRAQRMTVSASRISFWNASTPNSFHEMDAATVPRSVVDALARTGANAEVVDWGVTLPGKLSGQLGTLMQQHTGGSLVIRADGNLTRESGR